MFRLIKKMFAVFLTRLVNASSRIKYVSLCNQKYDIQFTLINLHPREFNQISLLFAIKLERCVGSCDTLNDLSNKVCVPNNTEDLNIHVFDMIQERINQKF